MQLKRIISTGALEFAVLGAVLLGIFVTAGTTARAKVKSETISAQSFGTGTQMGTTLGVTLNIYQYSTPDDRAALVQAYEKGQNQGLYNALQKMRAVGHVEITGTLGNDCAYIRMIPTPTGRRIIFVTSRIIRFGAVAANSPSAAYDLTGGILDLNDQDKKKSTGVLYPAAQLVLDKQGELRLDLNQNPWRLSNFIDWKGTPGVN